jgi:cell division protein FtsZ
MPQMPHADYGKRPPARPAPQPSLDVHGRVTPATGNVEDDQLEIPAFLRRQAN